MDSTPARKLTFEQVVTEEQTHARLRLHLLCEFMREKDGKFITTWECNFLSSLDDNQKLHKEVITEGQRSTLAVIYNRLVQGGHL